MPPRSLPHIPTPLAERARQQFQHRYSEPLTVEDGREIAANLLGFFGLLEEWREARRASPSAARTASPAVRQRARRSSHAQE